jgi:hypothetical protein
MMTSLYEPGFRNDFERSVTQQQAWNVPIRICLENRRVPEAAATFLKVKVTASP